MPAEVPARSGLHRARVHDAGAPPPGPYALEVVEQAARALFWPTPEEKARAAQHALDRVAQEMPVTLEALLEVKACVALGCLPESGGLLEQTGGFPSMVKFLTAKGIIEGRQRGGGGL